MTSPGSCRVTTYDRDAIIVEMCFFVKLFFYVGMFALWPLLILAIRSAGVFWEESHTRHRQGEDWSC